MEELYFHWQKVVKVVKFFDYRLVLALDCSRFLLILGYISCKILDIEIVNLKDTGFIF